MEVANAHQSRAPLFRVWGIALLLFGVLVLSLTGDGMPERASLTEITGRLRSLENSASKGGGIGSVRFTLATDSRHFIYHSAAGEIDQVWASLNQAGNAEVKVLIAPAQQYTLPLDERTFHEVLGVAVGETTVRSYAEVAASLGTNDLIGRILGYGSAAVGTLLTLAAFLVRPHKA